MEITPTFGKESSHANEPAATDGMRRLAHLGQR
jgi:hypothetical protein